MKSKLYLLISLVMLALLIVGLYIKWPSPKQAKEPIEKGEVIELVSIEAIQGFTIQQEKESFLFEKNQDTKQWEVDGRPVINAAEVQALVSLITELQVTRKVPTDQESKEAFGLVDPKTRIIINDQEVFSLGHLTPTKDGYYGEINRSKSIVIVPPIYEKLINYAHETPQVRMTEESDSVQLEEIYYRNKEMDFTIRRYEKQGDQHFSGYYLEAPYKTKPQVEEQHEDFIALLDFSRMALPSLKFDNVEGLSEETLGLKEPQVELAIRNSAQEEKRIIVGNESEKDSNLYFVKFNDDAQIYQLFIEDAPLLFNINATKMAVQAPIFTFIDKLNTLKIKHEDTQFTIDLSANQNGEDAVYRVNDVEVNQKEIKKLYLSLLELGADAAISEEYNTNEEIIFEVTASYEDGETTKVSYQSYDEWFYQIIIDEHSDFVIAKDKFEDLFEQLENLKKLVEK